jgi:hypothetical protein
VQFANGVLVNPLVALVPVTLLLVFWAWMFADMMRNSDLSPEERSTWTWLFLLLNVFAAAFYYATVHTRRR